MKKVTKKLQSINKPTFEKYQDFMGHQFKKVFEKLNQHSDILSRHSKALEIILKEMQEQRKEAREHRMMMNDLNRTDVIYHRKIEGLELRI